MAKPGSKRAIAAAATAPAADAVNSAAAEGAPFTITTPLYYVNAGERKHGGGVLVCVIVSFI
jgi:hypothetical protein